MANHREGNVIYVDTSAQFSDIRNVKSIKYFGAGSSSITIKAGSSTGKNLWFEDSSSDVYNGEVCIRSDKGIYVTVSGSATVYIYTE